MLVRKRPKPTTTDLQLQPNAAPALSSKRIASVDVYRGFVMLLMMAEVLSFQRVSKALPGNGFWSFLAFHQDHVAWVGCSLHDLIQPSFSFLVGVALPFSIAGRMSKGVSFSALFRHTLVRSLLLILIGIFLRSMGADHTNFTFEDTLTQIGLGYPFLFLLAFTSKRWQVTAFILILVLYWAAYALYPLPGSTFDYSAVGVSPSWAGNAQGFTAHWNKNTNLAWAFDTWFLNLFPREHVFTHNEGGYATLSFIPTLATMILGLWAGATLKTTNATIAKVRQFVLVGLGLMAAGLVLHAVSVNPIVKRIWTPSWVLFSGGCCYLLLGVFYGIVDGYDIKKWAFPLMVIGMNSIAAYVIAHTLPGFIDASFSIHISQQYDQVLGGAYQSLVQGGAILLVEYWVLYWMYKQRVFIKV